MADKPSKPLAAGSSAIDPSPAGYIDWLTKLKVDIRQAQSRALFSVNAEMIRLYWRIGRGILERQEQQGWGASVIPRLSADLRVAFPNVKGFSARNLSYMKAFAEAWPSEGILQALSAKLPWSHQIALLDKLDGQADRLWYAQAAAEHGWSTRVLAHQIDTRLHEREGRSMNNFAATLPPPHSDMVKAVFKDEYIFDFAEIASDAHERHLEAKLTEKITRFLLEMGKGFAFVGSQYHVNIGSKDFYIDLLLYHTRLHRYVVIDLKMDAFTPEYAGKMNFYINLINRQVCTEGDNPTVGLLLCRERDHLIVDYSLGGIDTPIAVSGYRPNILPPLPPEIANELPGREEVGAKLEAIIARDDRLRDSSA
jgi:predicted nuclease of restriction endonuclease-like (RecB) superfamily